VNAGFCFSIAYPKLSIVSLPSLVTLGGFIKKLAITALTEPQTLEWLIP
jgi:hypothetical protein